MKLPAHAVILAGGRGTRFWPRSRTRTPKQLLNIVGTETMIEQTARRIAPLFPASRIWVVTQAEQAEAVRRQLPNLPREHVIVEPEGRNTAAAIALASVHLRRECGDVVMAVLPADHVITRETRYRALARRALRLAAAPDAMVILGIEPSRPETGYGYIERGREASGGHGANAAAFLVRRFTEKPALPMARRYVASGCYFWNAGMFFWRASTFLAQLHRFLPATAQTLAGIEDAIGEAKYATRLRRAYRRLANISVDYAVLEPASRAKSGPRVIVVPAKGVGWSDVGSWAAVFDLLAARPGDNVTTGETVTLDAQGNYFWAPRKLVAAIGVRDLVVVETPDALLVCPRDRAQDVGRIVKELDRRKLRRLL